MPLTRMIRKKDTVIKNIWEKFSYPFFGIITMVDIIASCDEGKSLVILYQEAYSSLRMLYGLACIEHMRSPK